MEPPPRPAIGTAAARTVCRLSVMASRDSLLVPGERELAATRCERFASTEYPLQQTQATAVHTRKGLRMNIRRTGRLLAACLLGYCSSVLAAADGSQLELPAGADVAIVVFEDLQCPDCRRVHPDLLAAADANRVPLVIRDFPIPRHAWAFPAAVLARYFAARSPALGVEFRSFIFQNQPGISADNLREFGDKFAQQHGMQLPPDVDPDGKLAAQVQADFDLGRQIRLEYVPLVFVIGPGQGDAHFVEVTEPKELGAAIEAMRRGSLP
jgi:protein-disulfide isomerase